LFDFFFFVIFSVQRTRRRERNAGPSSEHPSTSRGGTPAVTFFSFYVLYKPKKKMKPSKKILKQK
jgi:hypothetical protein